ncbi:hypothetical protein GYMLUDRAFT_756506 [Collybiopsis luxurians FD-317 M1]|uniref:Uncharacterized protein n=1 Tax=Collybiopsis luxurians FD-317 M1 TaxID=944289 RepID=A0A0D0BQH5_9AGAR|nr:hypothetical protein GYMLUDRAFT_756506 [Collybiopsis luxurians FD-317 M1]
MKLQNVAVTPDGVRLLGVGPLLKSPDGLESSRSRVEKRLTVYNMETSEMEHTTPPLNDVKDITLAKNTRNGLVALVSYENKAPPQLWKLEIIKRNNKDTARLTLRHTYIPKSPVDFAGSSYFGGKSDELVLRAGKGNGSLTHAYALGGSCGFLKFFLTAGGIHIWDQESGALLHHVRAQDLGGDLTCIAWNHAVDNPFMFATGSHDGAVRVWTRPEQSEKAGLDMDDLQRTESSLGFKSSFASSSETLRSRASLPRV